MFYPEELVEEIRTRNDIVDVISGYVKLTKRGSTYFGLCPFHNEKSPSFSVTPSKQMYYCFGCGAGGNVITFLMEYENYTFREALQVLADRAGIELPKVQMSEEQKREADLKTTLLEINKEAGKYFYYQLKQPHGEKAYRYLRGRGLTDETIRHFGLGYSNPYRDDLYQYMKKKGYKDEVLKETGLFRIEERGANDKFWNRAMFPIMDANNRIIGFGGRVMGDGEPKYLNSPETKLFDKSRNLYGLNYARSTKRPYMLICEGYMDVISMHQAGFTNAVASLGTALTTQQAALLKRYTDQVVLTYDSDGAGTKAAMRAIPILKNAGLSVKVLNLKPYKDPDEFIQNMGAEAFEQRVAEATNHFLFEIDVLKRDYDMRDPEQKTAFYNTIAKKLLEFPEELERNNYLEAVCERYFIPAESLRRLVNQKGYQKGLMAEQSKAKPASELPEVREPGQEPDVKKRGKEKDDGLKLSQRMLLTWLINDKQIYGKIKKWITPADFTEALYRQTAEMVFAQLETGAVSPGGILNHFINDEEEYREVAKVFNTELPAGMTKEEREKAFLETVKRVKKNSLDTAGRSATDMATLQRIIKEQAALANLHISLD
ncbi:MAG: DNA primase [Lachnospiraceae bacterium]|nr:DNA primase [Lachnospiraceae bacterium]